METRPLTGAEALAVSALTFFATPPIVCYLLDRAGLPFPPAPMLVVSTGAGVAMLVWLARRANWRSADTAAFCGVVIAVFAGLMWMAQPSFLPLGTGSDLTHHLLLIGFIERHWTLVHDAAVEPYLGEMVHYTPGSQVLAALAGAWMRSDGFHAVHPVVAASVAFKAGFVLLVALRVLPRGVPRIPLALLSAGFLLLPGAYVLGSFIQDSFFAQVVAELFAVGMWWALVVWDTAPWWPAALIFTIAGTAAFLTWPVWTGAPLLAALFVFIARRQTGLATRLRDAAIAAAPLSAIAAFYILERLGWLAIAGTSGVVLHPSVREYGWPFLLLSTTGLLIAIVPRWGGRGGRVTALFAGAIGVEAAALYAVSRTRGAEIPYLALKMAYLAVYPQAVAAVLPLAAIWRMCTAAVPQSRRVGASRWHAAEWIASGLAAFLIVRIARPVTSAKRPPPVVSESLYDAGLWARNHLPPGCVDYLVGHDFTAYWLHLAVLGNPRMSARTGNNETFESQAALIRWLTPGGLPYAVAELPTLPRDIRNELDVVAAFGDAAVVKRRGASSCAEANSPQGSGRIG